MALDSESFNKDLYDLLKVRGYRPVPLDSKNQRVPASQAADVIEFTFTKDGEDYGKSWVSIDDASNVIVYYDEEQQESPSTTTPGAEYDDSWTGFLKHLKNWAQRRQLSFELSNKDRLGDDMRQRDYYKMKEKLGESKKTDQFGYEIKGNKKPWGLYHTRPNKPEKLVSKHHNKNAADAAKWDQLGMGATVKGEKFTVKKIPEKDPVQESYHPMGKKASYNDAVPNVKIVLQHNRSLEEGEARFRNVAKIYLENAEGERFLAPTNKPGLARVYARHIAEGGVPNDEKWNHIKSVCEDYAKMAGFVRATRNGQFNESAQELVQEGINHYNSLRETLHKLSTHRGYQNYFESWSPPLMEDELDESINELFVQEMVDPRIESAMPILSRLKKPVAEMAEVDNLAEWADGIINEKLELDEMDKEHGSKRDFDNARVPDKTAKPMSVKQFAKGALKSLKRGMKGWEKGMHDVDTVKAATKSLSPDSKEELLKAKVGKGSPAELQQKLIKREKNKKVDEGTDSKLEAFLDQYPEAKDAMYNALRHFEYAYDAMDHVAGHVLHKIPYSEWEKVRQDFIDYFEKNGLKGDVDEGLDANQKSVNTLGPTEKVKNNNIGKLVGASESKEIDPELARIMEMARFKR